jgi:anti-sigma B factor antagonist
MNIEQRTIGDVRVLSVIGDITMKGTAVAQVADTVRGALQAGRQHFVLDLGHVRYVDSAGLGELVQAWSAVRNRGGAMKLLNVTKRLNDLLVVTRLPTMFDCFDAKSAALASFEPRAGPPRSRGWRVAACLTLLTLTTGCDFSRPGIEKPYIRWGSGAALPRDRRVARLDRNRVSGTGAFGGWKIGRRRPPGYEGEWPRRGSFPHESPTAAPDGLSRRPRPETDG